MKKIYLSGKLGEGKFTLVDDENYDELNNYIWNLSNWGYVKRGWRSDDGKSRLRDTIFMHRQVMQLCSTSKMQIDHINHDPLDNRKCNLRICNNRENHWNVKPHQDSLSKYKGVSFNKKDKKWTAHICVDGKDKNLGNFDCEKEAARIYNKMAKKLHKEYAYLNLF